MEHVLFRILSVITAIIMSSFYIIYDYYSLHGKDIVSDMLLKALVTLCPFILISVYFCKYRISTYSFLMSITIFCCLVGDICLGVMQPHYEKYGNVILFIVGGFAFLCGRICLSVNLALKPFNSNGTILITYPRKRYILISLPVLIIHVGMGVTSIAIFKNGISGLLFIYIILGLSFNLSYGILRIGELNEETNFSTIITLIGIVFFNISDILLFMIMLTDILPKYMHLITNLIYWIGLYFLSISIVRTKTVRHEKQTIFNYYDI